jgi:DNA mismatch repair protein MutS
MQAGRQAGREGDWGLRGLAGEVPCGAMGDPRATPAMQQYYRFKKRHPGCVLMFRMGDFYEMFDEDAVAVSKAIGLTLTQRTEGVPMAGVPFHQLEGYLRKLIGAGFRVAVAEQLIEASQAKGVVPRAVTRVLTPGTLVDDALIEPEARGALAAAYFMEPGDESPAALAVVEVSTGEFLVTQCSAGGLVDELSRRGVRELLYSDATTPSPPARVARVLTGLGLAGTPRPAWQFRPQESRDALAEHFGVATLQGFGLRDDAPEVCAAGAVVRYIRETQTMDESDVRGVAGVRLALPTLAHLRPPRLDQADDFCQIDAVSLRALEVERTVRGGDSLEGTLVGLFVGPGRASVCRTAMGRRLIRDWLCRPLRRRESIEARQACVAALVEDRGAAEEIGQVLAGVQDTPRIAARLAMARASPRDLVGLASSVMRGEALAAAMAGVPALAVPRERIQRAWEGARGSASAILVACVDEPPPTLRDGGVIRDGHDAELDEARLLQRDAGAWLAEYQRSLAEKHALPGLKVGYNRVFGYYIELPQAQARQAPPELQRKQTLRSAERYTTPELADFERKVTTAQTRALERERDLFAGLCGSAVGVMAAVAEFGVAVAQVDCALGLADKAAARGWTRPTIADGPVLSIHGGRHPVLDELLRGGFVANDVELGDLASAGAGGEARPALALITGPNMAGKSTYIRQVALLTLLAHAGSFIPADRATIGVTDRIFTRIGADDSLHAGQSTFMVEMIETANILNHATPGSLVVLDEVGRGTSTLDGLSLAWAIVEHLAKGPGTRALFATHYHELTSLQERFPGRVQNLHVAVREWPRGGDHADIVFLHRILPGSTDQSYGLHVARLAGVPAGVIARAREVLASLAVHHGPAPADEVPAPTPPDDGPLTLFTRYVPHPALESLRELKLDAITPMQAFDELRRLQERVRSGPGGG